MCELIGQNWQEGRQRKKALRSSRSGSTHWYTTGSDICEYVFLVSLARHPCNNDNDFPEGEVSIGSMFFFWWCICAKLDFLYEEVDKTHWKRQQQQKKVWKQSKWCQCFPCSVVLGNVHVDRKLIKECKWLLAGLFLIVIYGGLSKQIWHQC